MTQVKLKTGMQMNRHRRTPRRSTTTPATTLAGTITTAGNVAATPTLAQHNTRFVVLHKRNMQPRKAMVIRDFNARVGNLPIMDDSCTMNEY